MADTAHYQTDLKLEEMEKRLSAIYSGVEKTVQKKMADYAKSIDEKSSELLQAYNDAETDDEKRKAKMAYIRFYRKLVKSKEPASTDFFRLSLFHSVSFLRSTVCCVYPLYFSASASVISCGLNPSISFAISALM